MKLHLARSQRGKQEHCRCPRSPRTLTPQRTAPMESLGILAVFVAVMAVLAIFFVEIAVLILGIWLIGAVFGITWRLARGHTFSCAMTWGSTDVIYAVIKSSDAISWS